MSDSSGQKDLSMEEILGSIRRIISEDSTHGGSAEVGESGEDADEDVLELTDEISDADPAESRREPILGMREPDEDVSAAPDEPEERREPVLGGVNAEPSDGDDGELRAERDEESTVEVGEPFRPTWSEQPEPDENVVVQGGTTADDSTEADSGDAAYGGDSPGEPDEAVRSEEFEEETSEIAVRQEEEPMTISSDEFAGDEAGGHPAPGADTIVSAAASSATTAALSELNRAMAEKGSRMKVGDGDITIAEMVRDLLRPMLREWLDENLPGIVERVVKREIQKLVDRTQDDD